MTFSRDTFSFGRTWEDFQVTRHLLVTFYVSNLCLWNPSELLIYLLKVTNIVFNDWDLSHPLSLEITSRLVLMTKRKCAESTLYSALGVTLEWVSHAQIAMVTWLPLEKNEIIVIYDITFRRQQSYSRNRSMVCFKCLTGSINAWFVSEVTPLLRSAYEHYIRPVI
jgi:hypothetical protein